MPSAQSKGAAFLDCDVLILGGGPAGSATALALRKHAPALSVVLVEASSYDEPRIGEVLPAQARDLLDYLGVWQGFAQENHRSAHSTISLWGHSLPRENHFIFSAYGSGWHLDRTGFDAFLNRQAAQNGAAVLLNTRLKAFEKTESGWSVRLSDDSDWRARFIVDATGRRAFFAQKMGAVIEADDRLISFSRFFTLDDVPAPETLIEAFADGWWYTARAGKKRVVSCLTDPDIARCLRLSDKRRWLEIFFKTDRIKKSVGDGILDEKSFNRAANSARITPACGTDWLAVGDAASAFDPLSSQGIIKSLRSAVFASYAIADLLVKSEKKAALRYAKFIETEFVVYRKLYKKHYSNERRWRENLFWQRRQN
jgi:flavin-dependent dehydrogenase